ncbi:Nucleotidyl transferase [Galbibacter marinus]|uniref:Nucleotidyl transferase n=1 Tax=Galbibacter marinus TaxID=555500 RepID=K2P062_9FLAO|nr:nucleotidyltransferase family protein [Galbibacter marinus]EKF54433.1 Nucleotidyl transferase [Galbibacter marinus]
MDLQSLLIHKNSTILEALVKLNALRNISRLILFVINKENAVIGSLTDGDIRRSLAKYADLDLQVGSICNYDFAYELENKNNRFIQLSEYNKNNIKILPILDHQKRLVRIIDLVKTRAVLPMECMIMAGGRGKRLSPLTDKMPKPMLPLGGKPIIEHNIDRLISFGITKFYISLKYLGQQIQDYFGDGSKKGVQIEYVWEDEPLGTAGALSLVPEFKTDHVLLMNSDLFTNIDFEDLYLNILNKEGDMIVASTEYKVDVPYAVFETNGSDVKSFKEKPTFRYQSNAGIYILKKELVDEIPKNEFYDITTLMDKLVEDGKKLLYNPILGFWIDIGKPVDYDHAQEFIKHIS